MHRGPFRIRKRLEAEVQHMRLLEAEEMKILLIAGLLVLVLIEYSMCVASHRADEQAARMYKRWKDERSNNKTE